MSTSSVAPTQLILLRHGQTTWNRLKIVQGHDDAARLTDEGREQVRHALQELRDVRVDHVISSDLQRAIETAHIVTQELGVPSSIDPSLRERSFGVLEGGAVSDATTQLTGIEGDWVVDATARPEGGESLDDLYRRTASFVDRVGVSFRGKRVLAVTHGGAIRTMRAYCEGAAMLGRHWDDVPNCSVWVLQLPRIVS